MKDYDLEGYGADIDGLIGYEKAVIRARVLTRQIIRQIVEDECVVAIEIGREVQEIAPHCFENVDCANIDFSNAYNVQKIGAYAFKGATGINGGSFDGVKSAGEGAFMACEGSEINLPNLEKLPEMCFCNARIEGLNICKACQMEENSLWGARLTGLRMSDKLTREFFEQVCDATL